MIPLSCTPGRVGDAFNIQTRQVCVYVYVCVCVHMHRLTRGKNCRGEKFSAQSDLAFSIILFWLVEQALFLVYVLNSLKNIFSSILMWKM